MYTAITDFADRRDAHRHQTAGPDRPTVQTVYWRALQYTAGALAAVYVAVGVMALAEWRVAVAGLSVGVAGGAAVRRVPVCQRAATTWTAVLTVALALWACVLAVVAM